MPANFKVLINYSENDNNPSIDSGKGWVDSFSRFLNLMLHQVIGSKPEIVLLSGTEAIAAQMIEGADAMVCIISPYFIDNPNCLDALEDFYLKSREKEAQRVFKVLKAPVKIKDQPVRLRELIGYDMFHYDDETQEAEEFKPYLGQDSEREFWMKMVDLVYDVHETYLIGKGVDLRRVRPIQDRKAVYLAETAHDLTIQRNIIKRELQRYGFRVLPIYALPPSYDDVEKQIKKNLEQCSLTIHLIGTSYGEIPDGSTKSVIDIQNSLAVEWSTELRKNSKIKNKIYRFIWIVPDLRVASEKQLTFIENIKRDIAALEGAEILQLPLEDFKNIVRDELFSTGDKSDMQYVPEDENDNARNVYLIHDQVDKESVEPIKEEIQNMGYNVLEPTFEGDLLDLREGHIYNLRKLDFALIYQGHVNDQWVRMKLLDLLKAPGFGRIKPILNKGVLIGKHSKGDFEKLNDDKHVEIIHESGNKPPVNDIQKFLQTRQQVL
ncbi:MAG: DUF4062 domain-containing protein [Bacteroidetes bacterium]|nr:DUF4062 domain-containing protein [Bacteroidota bacterium]